MLQNCFNVILFYKVSIAFTENINLFKFAYLFGIILQFENSEKLMAKSRRRIYLHQTALSGNFTKLSASAASSCWVTACGDVCKW